MLVPFEKNELWTLRFELSGTHRALCDVCDQCLANPGQEVARLAAKSNPLGAETCFLDVKFAAQLEEDFVVNDCLSAQTR